MDAVAPHLPPAALPTPADPAPAQVPAPALSLVQSPPAPVVEQPAAPDPSETLNLRLRRSTIRAISATSKARGLTIKQIVTHALREAGIQVANVDLEDRTPKRAE
ncbi:MAG: hypothetical protein M3Q65_13840 [Chloroflexota bacterium]|nr:hypothetical protein [Chloroflexota bacterium]